MHDKSVEAMRAVLTVTGLVLLFIFGARAAGQARDMSLAGANHRSVLPTVSIANVTHLNPWLAAVPATAHLLLSEQNTKPTYHKPASIGTTAQGTLTVDASGSATMVASETDQNAGKLDSSQKTSVAEKSVSTEAVQPTVTTKHQTKTKHHAESTTTSTTTSNSTTTTTQDTQTLE